MISVSEQQFWVWVSDETKIIQTIPEMETQWLMSVSMVVMIEHSKNFVKLVERQTTLISNALSTGYPKSGQSFPIREINKNTTWGDL